MNEKDLENLIKKAMKIEESPEPSSLYKVLSSLEDSEVVTVWNVKHYSISTKVSNIISNGVANIVDVWRSNRAVILVPTFIILFFVGAFSLSPTEARYNKNIIKLAEKDAIIEEPFINDDVDQIVSTLFDSPAINDLSKLQDEI